MSCKESTCRVCISVRPWCKGLMNAANQLASTEGREAVLDCRGRPGKRTSSFRVETEVADKGQRRQRDHWQPQSNTVWQRFTWQEQVQTLKMEVAVRSQRLRAASGKRQEVGSHGVPSEGLCPANLFVFSERDSLVQGL